MHPTTSHHGGFALATQLTRQSQSSFRYAFAFLPRERRQALHAVYAYCRLIDDVVDGSDSLEFKLAGLQEWRLQLDAAFSGGRPTHPIAEALAVARQRFGLHYKDALAVLQGCAMDLYQTRYSSWDELREYCLRVGSAVGLLCIELFGYTSRRSQEYAVHLGLALQLTNILRDVGDDAARGRIYIPIADLVQFNISEQDIIVGRRSPQMQRLLGFFSQRAHSEFRSARTAFPAVDRWSLLPAQIMHHIYLALLRKLDQRGCDVLDPSPRIKLRQSTRLLIAAGTVLRTMTPWAGGR